ncbi:hypothetical protein K1719_006244 [Acacia pycnantha]|nr:hypothetical protein K1719_006244 [Acacia pycnantha]
MSLLYSLHLKLAVLVTTAVAAAAAKAQTKPGIKRSSSTAKPPRSPSSGEGTTQLISGFNIPVLNISLDHPELTFSGYVSKHCYDSNKDSSSDAIDLSSTFSTGCSLSCSDETRFEEAGACSGVGCCQTSFPQAITNYNITLLSFNNYMDVRDFNPCGYAFVAKEGSFNFSSRELLDLSNATEIPVVVDWAVSNQTDGFRGNPYLDTGCKDINECDGDNHCSRRCHNVDGNYKCSCPLGYRGNGYKDGSSCKFPIIEVSLGIFVGLLVVFILQLHQQQGYIDRTKVFTEDELKIATNNFDEMRILGRGGQGTIHYRISTLSWETRLRIAVETAEAISFLHSAASIPIIHCDIKSANILLDHSHQAKVSDFGASRLVPLDETQVTTVVQGTLGSRILDNRVFDQKNAKRLKEVAFLARRCIRVNGKERPTMKEVATELEGLIAMKKHPWVKGRDMMSEEYECLLGHVATGYGNASASTSAAYDSIQKQLAFDIEDAMIMLVLSHVFEPLFAIVILGNTSTIFKYL